MLPNDDVEATQRHRRAEREPRRPAATARKTGPRARTCRGGSSAWVLVVLASLLIPVSVISVWAIRTVTNTDQYVATMAPWRATRSSWTTWRPGRPTSCSRPHVVQNKVTRPLPPKAKPHRGADREARCTATSTGWRSRSSRAPSSGSCGTRSTGTRHDAVVDILTGKQTPLTKKLEKGGADRPQLSRRRSTTSSTRPNAEGVTLFNPLKPILTKSDGLGVTVVSKQQVSKFSGLFNLVVKLKWAIPVIALVLAVLGHRRSRWSAARRCCGWRSGWPCSPCCCWAASSVGRTCSSTRPSAHSFNAAGRRRRLGHRAALPQDGPALDAAGLGARRPRRLAGRAGPLRGVDPLDRAPRAAAGWPPRPAR